MMHRVDNCFGFPLWKSKNKYAEIWFCFSEVKPHSHPGQNVEIVPLFGWSTFSRVTDRGEKQSVTISPRTWFHGFSVPADFEHWFVGVPLVFLNISDRSAGTNISWNL